MNIYKTRIYMIERDKDGRPYVSPAKWFDGPDIAANSPEEASAITEKLVIALEPPPAETFSGLPA